MAAKNFFICNVCDKILNDPVVLPCQCLVCHEHIKFFYTTNDPTVIKCKSCSEESKMPLEGFRVHKKFKFAIENDDHLSSDEKQLKAEMEKKIKETDQLYDILYCKDKALLRFSAKHSEQIRSTIVRQKNLLKTKLDKIADEMIRKSEEIEEKFNERVKACQQQLKGFGANFAKESQFLADLFRLSNLTLDSLTMHKIEQEKKLHDMNLMLSYYDKIQSEYASIRFEPQKPFEDNIPFGSLQQQPGIDKSNDANIENMTTDETSVNNLDFVSPILIGPATTKACDTSVSISNTEYQQNANDNHLNNTFNHEANITTSLSNLNSNNEINQNIENHSFYLVFFSKKANCEEFYLLNINSLNLKKKCRCMPIAKCSCIQVFQSDKLFSGLENGTIKLYDLKDGSCLKTFGQIKSDNHPRPRDILALCVLSGDTLISGGKDNLIKIWNIQSGSRLMTLEGHTSWINRFVVTENGLLISASNDGTFKMWNPSDGQLIRSLAQPSSGFDLIEDISLTLNKGISCMKLLVEDESSDSFRRFGLRNHRIIFGRLDGSVEMWDYVKGVCLLKVQAHATKVCQLLVNLKDHMFISCSHDRTIKMWNLETGKLIKILYGHHCEVLDMVMRFDGKLVSGSNTGDIKVWDLDEGKCLKTVYGHVASVDQLQFCDLI